MTSLGAASIAMLGGCGGADGVSDEKYMPDNAAGFVSINSDQILSTSLVDDLIDIFREEYEEGVGKTKEQWGIEPEDVSRITLWFVEGDDEPAYIAVATSGISDAMWKKQVEELDGEVVTINGADFVSGGRTGYARIDGSLLLMGDANAISAMLERDGEPDVDPSLAEAMDAVDLSSSVSVVLSARMDRNFQRGLEREMGPMYDAIRHYGPPILVASANIGSSVTAECRLFAEVDGSLNEIASVSGSIDGDFLEDLIDRLGSAWRESKRDRF